MIHISNMSYSYNYVDYALRNVSVDFKEGQVYGLLGSNGAGKSTLIKTICGLIYPEGECSIDEQSASSRSPKTLSLIGYLPEDPYIPNVTITQYADALKQFYTSFDDVLFNEYLTSFEVPKKQLLSKMSLGQRKKAVIALTFALNTPILILDEPTNGLDIPSKTIFRRYIKKLKSDNRTIIISTHQVRDVEELLSSVVILNQKSILLDSTIEEIEKKLFFGNVTAEDSPLYYESDINGSKGVKKNTAGESSHINLEFLFNAVISNPEAISSIFK